MDRIFTRWLMSNPVVCGDTGPGALTLTLGEVRTPFASLAVGMGLAMLVLISECIFRLDIKIQLLYICYLSHNSTTR